MLKVKPYSSEYKEDLQRVCLNTAYPSAYEPVERNYLLNTYCDYYLDNEQQTCFACVDENDTAQGYVLCTPDYKKYLRLVIPYDRRAAKSGLAHFCESAGERVALLLFCVKYPAHLHININPGFQNNGMGTKLLSTLIETLKNKKVRGVMLITGSGNTGAIRFYKRNGFRTLAKLGPACVMGMKLC